MIHELLRKSICNEHQEHAAKPQYITTLKDTIIDFIDNVHERTAKIGCTISSIRSAMH